jgi:DNA-binding transcriptional LysR family regulator
MDTERLRQFTVVCEELHFGRAALRLHIAQSALSRQIQNLENELQTPLFTRTKRRVQLTPAGKVFLDEARVVIATMKQAIQAARRAAEGKTGTLNIGFVGSASLEFLPPILRSFRTEVPSVEIILSEMTTTEQTQALQSKRIDVGFMRPPIEAEDLSSHVVFSEELVAALPAHHPLAKHSRIQLKWLAREPFVLFPAQEVSSWQRFVTMICMNAGFHPNIVQRTTQIHTAMSLVSAEIGVCLVPSAARNLLKRGIAFRPISDVTPKAELVVVYRRGESSPLLGRFLTLIHNSSNVKAATKDTKARTRSKKG